jgi:hypothetical protein
MRLVLSHDDARELDALMTAHPGVHWEFVFEGGSEATVIFLGARFTGRMRRTPSSPGTFVIEDFDGRRIAEAVAEDEGERP